MDCPSRELLARFIGGQLPPADVDTLAAHVEQCEHCVALLTTVSDSDALQEAMRGPRLDAPEPATELLDQLLALRPTSLATTSVTAPVGGLLAQLTALAPESTLELYDFLAPPQAPGELGWLGPYRVLRLLGAGGMGIVFEVEDADLKRHTALKVLRPALAASQSARRRFQREAQAAAALQHDLIVPIFHIGEVRGLPFLTMPLLVGETLEERLQRETMLPVADLIHVGHEVAAGLAVAHAIGLIHRDVKPSNIFLVRAETGFHVRLLDFGLALAVGGDTNLTQSGVIVGTPAYMAPEQAQGEPIDQRTDVFSLGCVLYRAATGTLPFPGRNAMEMLLALAQQQPTPPRKRNPQLPPALADFIMHLLAKKPDERPPSAQSVGTTLADIAAGKTQRRPKVPRRWQRGGLLVAAMVCVALVLGVRWWPKTPQPDNNDEPTPRELFAPPVFYDAGLYPNAVSMGDFNNDGRPDLVVANIQSHTVGVLLGNRDGTFQPPRSSPAGEWFAFSTTVADLNRDGKLDLVVANSGSHQISVLLGRGDGTFAPPTQYGVDTNPSFVAVADLNGDGKPDLCAANGKGTVSVLLGNGDGTVQAATNVSVGEGCDKVLLADFNHDGHPDIVATDRSGQIALLLGKGDGQFHSPIVRPLGITILDLVAGDWNGDGVLDLLAAGASGMHVFIGDGAGNFVKTANYGADKTYRAVVGIDLDGDGILDLALANEVGHAVDVFLGKGDGSFREAQSCSVGRHPIGLAVSDCNGDGRPDLVVANKSSNNVAVLLQHPRTPPQVQLGPAQFVPVAKEPVAVAVADLFRTGADALVIADYASHAVHVLRNQGDSTFQNTGRFATGKGPTALAVADVNRDGKPDVVVANALDNSISLLHNQAQGGFAPAKQYAVGNNPVSLVVGDLNHDGSPDVIVANYESGTISVLLGQKDGTLGAAVPFPAGGHPRALATADLNGDGKLDLVVANRFQVGTVSVLLGKGDGTLAAPVAYGVGSFPIGIIVADLNGDGKQDVAVANWGSSDVNVLLGKGNGTFAPPVNYSTKVGSPLALVASDFNADGQLDLAVSVGGDMSQVCLLFGLGDGTFDSEVQFSNTGLHPTGLAVGRFANSGRPSLVTANAQSGNVAILRNQPAAPALNARLAVSEIDAEQMTCLLDFRVMKPTTPGLPTDSTFTGTVKLQTTDPKADLPPTYTFTPDDEGSKQLRIIFRTPGYQSLTITDPQGQRLSSTATIWVLRPDELQLILEAPPSVEANKPFSVTVNLMNQFKTWSRGYGGTLHFTCTDSTAKLPADDTFNRDSVRTYTNALQLPTPGEWKLTVTDTAHPKLSASITVKVR